MQVKENNKRRTESFLMKVADKLSEENYSEQAAGFYCERIKSDPDAHSTLEELITRLYDQQKYNEIISLIKNCPLKIKLSKTEHLLVAKSYLQQKRFSQALAYLKASKVVPDHDIFNVQGLCYDGLKKHIFAQKVYTKALALNPTSRTVRGNLAISYIHNHQIAKGLTLLKDLNDEPNSTLQDQDNYEKALLLSGKMTE